MLQLAQLKKEVSQNITVVEASAMTGEGIDSVLKWLQGDRIASPKSSKWLVMLYVTFAPGDDTLWKCELKMVHM